MAVMAVIVAVVAGMMAAQAPVLLDRTVAVVGGRTITHADVRTAARLGLIEEREVTAAAVTRLVERELMLREAERYAPDEPSPDAVAARLAEAERRAGGAEALATVLAAGGFTADRLRAWVRDDLRLEAYLRQRFAADDRRPDLIADWVSDLRRRTSVVVFAP